MSFWVQCQKMAFPNSFHDNHASLSHILPANSTISSFHLQSGSKVNQKFCNILVTFVLFFKLQQKQPSIQSRNYHVALSEITFLLVLVLWGIKLSLKLPPALDCWSITRAENKPWIETSNIPMELGLDYILGVASVLYPQVPRFYPRKLVRMQILQNLTHPSIFILLFRRQTDQWKGKCKK